MLAIATPAEMNAIDRAAPESLDELIERAASRVAWAARDMLGGVYGRRVAVLAGPGNNGADARVAARKLDLLGVRTAVLAPDADVLPDADLIIDGAFGTGMNRRYDAPVNRADAPVLAVDIVSGIDGLTGQILGSPLAADRTVTFAALKPGLLLHPGAALCGSIQLVDIGLDVSLSTSWLLTEDDARSMMPVSNTDTHKWKRAVWVIGGTSGMYGAPLLASRAALRTGSGMVWCGMPGQAAPALADEVVFADLPGRLWHENVKQHSARFGALVVGPGLGRSEEAQQSVRALVGDADVPIVIDGDALRLLGQQPALNASIVLTPHDGEYETLWGTAPEADRFAAARSLAAATGAVVLLKGPLTIVASPDGRCMASNRGDSRLATAGSGDVLAGTVASFVAAGMTPFDAAGLGAWVHGDAALSQRAVGMIASDLLAGLGTTVERLTTSLHLGGTHAPD